MKKRNETHYALFMTLCACLIAIAVFIIVQSKQQFIEPKPETELIKMVGESFKKTPENWKAQVLNGLSENIIPSSYYKQYYFVNEKCKIQVEYCKTTIKDSAHFSFGFFGFIIENKFENQEELFYWLSHKPFSGYSISDSFVIDPKSEISLSIKDMTYLNYQYEKFILPSLKIQKSKEDSISRMNERIQEIIDSKHQDKLREANYNKLKNNSCL